jgi:hypothetical protein
MAVTLGRYGQRDGVTKMKTKKEGEAHGKTKKEKNMREWEAGVIHIG